MEPEQIIANYYSIVDFAAKKIPKIVMQANAIDIEDIKQEGLIALLAAYKTYNPAKKVAFSTYAQTCVYNAMISYLRKLDPLPLSVRKDIQKIEKIKTQSDKRYTLKELSELSNLSESRIQKILTWNSLYLNMQEHDNDSLNNLSGTPEDFIVQKENINQIKTIIDSFQPREQRILLNKIIHKKPLRQIAAEENLTPARVSQIYSKLTKELFEQYSK